MRTAKVFRSGNSQTVRISVKFQFDADEVEIFRRDVELILRKKATSQAQAFHLLASLPDDFLMERYEQHLSGRPKDDLPQVRAGL